MDARERWQQKQELAAPGRFYGDGGTIHGTGHLDVEVKDGQVVAVWFRCQMLPFRVFARDGEPRHREEDLSPGVLTGVEIRDRDA